MPRLFLFCLALLILVVPVSSASEAYTVSGQVDGVRFAEIENDDGTRTYFALTPASAPFPYATFVPASSEVFTDKLGLNPNAEPDALLAQLAERMLEAVPLNEFETVALGVSPSGDGQQLFASGSLRTGEVFVVTAQATIVPDANRIFTELVALIIDQSGFPFGMEESLADGPIESDVELAIPDDCSQFSLATNTSVSMRSVEMNGFPGQLVENEATLTADDGTVIQALMVLEPDGRKMLQVPPHPTTPFAGGTFTFRVLDDTGASVCPEQTLAVGPLAEAPGAFADYVETVGEVLAAQRNFFALTEAQLLAGEVDSPVLFNLAASQWLYNSPNNPNSLVNIVDGTAPVLSDPAYDARLLDAVVAQAGLIDAAAAITVAYTGERAAGMAAPVPQEARLRDLGRKREINTAEELVEAFRDQQEAYDIVGGSRGDDWNNKALAATLIGVYNPIAGTILAAGIFVYKTPKDADMLLLPSKFDEVEFSIDGRRVTQVVYDEDDPFRHTFEDVVVEVSSEQWVLNTVINDARLVAVGALGVAGNITRTTDGLGLAGEVIDASALVADVSNNMCGRNVDACIGQEQQIVLGPYNWRVRLDNNMEHWETEYREPLPNDRSPILVAQDDNPASYRVRNAGFAQVRVRTTEALNSRRTGLGAAFVTVETIVVSHSPSSQRVEEFETACITTGIVNAGNTAVAWRVVESYSPTFPSPNELPASPSETCVNAPPIDEDTIEYTTPVLCSLDAVPIPKWIVVQGEATSETGARNPDLNPPPRNETATIGVVLDEQKLERNPPPPRPDCEEDEPTPEPPPLTAGTLEEIPPGLYIFQTFNGCSGAVEAEGELRIETYQDFSAYFDFMPIESITDEGDGIFNVQLNPGILLVYELQDGQIDLTSMVGAMPGLTPGCDNIVEQSFAYLSP